MGRFKEMELEIYPVKIWISVDESDSDLQERFSDDVDSLDNDTYAYCIETHLSSDNSYGVLLRFGPEDEIIDDVVVHECGHIAFLVLEHIEFVLDYNNQEPFTYLLQWVYREVSKFLNERTND